jgi:predicted phage-related endonuclease
MANIKVQDSIEATDDIVETIKELRRLEGLKKRLLELEEEYRLKIMDFMGTNQQLKEGAFTLVSWKSQTRRSFDTAAFRIEFDELYKSYLKETSMRVFRLC